MPFYKVVKTITIEFAVDVLAANPTHAQQIAKEVGSVEWVKTVYPDRWDVIPFSEDFIPREYFEEQLPTQMPSPTTQVTKVTPYP